MKVYRDIVVNGTTTQTEIFDIAECTYSGKDMGERSITANIKWATPIDFKIGDYVVLQMQTLIRSTTGVDGNVNSEKFYLYTMPTIKKNASPMSSGQAFEHTVTFYPAQYELGLVQMRDCGQEQANVDTIIYTGFDSLSFVGGADELMRRIMAVLKEAYHDTDGNPLWSYKIADAVNENKNTALERVSLSFSGNSVMDALLKLNDEEGLNTTFFINGRTIYVGYKRPYFCRVTDGGSIDTAPSSQMFQFQYGKTSHQPIALGHGGLYQITKALGKESPITKLFAYGAARNLNRYYCSDRIQSGRYVNRLMLPSFDADGKTDYILSEDSIKKYGIREGSKQFEEIYPSLRYITYGDLRQIKYCIKIKSSGIANDKLEQGNSAYPVARVQCYKVVPSGKTAGINKLVEAAPPDDLCVIVHAMGKTVKAVLYGGNTDSEAITKQRQHDTKVPTRTANGADYIPGSCFLVHDRGFDSNKTYQCTNRSEWFSNPNSISSLSDAKRAEINMNQIQYEDTFWLSDLYVFEGYSQTHFSRDGYSAWAWPRTTIDYQGGSADSTIVNEVAAVEPIVIEDTSSNVDDLETQQKTFDIYLKDVGFKIDEQNDFGDMVFVVGTELKISMLDGLMAGREFTAAAKVVDNQYTCICAYNEDGSLNNDFFMDSDYNKGDTIPRAALAAGAIWRICCNRINLDEADYSNLNLILPTKDLCVKKGDHLVFLDIYMPDIYIHAAENRLLREARKYLNANDNGSVSYSAQFDKVRLQQIPNYALQMREGLNIRMVDDDLGISTDNDGRYLSDYEDKPLYSSIDVPYTRSEWEYVTNYLDAAVSSGITQEFMDKFGHNVPENGDEMTVRIVLQKDETWIDGAPVQIIQGDTTYTMGVPARALSYGWCEEYEGYLYMLIFSKPEDLNLSGGDITIKRHQIKADSTLERSVWLSSNDAVDFTKGRFCTFKCRVKDNGYLAGTNAFALLSAKNDGIDGAKYLPTYTMQAEHKEKSNLLYLTFKFELPGNFNDDVVYYPSLLFNTDSRESGVGIWVESVYEKDYADGTAKLNYADFTIDSLTIKITNSNSNTAPIREITATFSENPAATAWATLMSNIENTRITGEQSEKAIEALVNTARKNYQTLLNLRNSIFDPDGTCDQTFLQVMMMQVGADSMNYQLDKTRTGLSSGGQQVFHNCKIEKVGSNWHFKVTNADTLRHYVYTQGAQGGTWAVTGGLDQGLDGASNYFICLKCSREGNAGEWVCSTKQYAVNDTEDTNSWFFNWGILTVDGGGNYTLVETRGNAYMYGDNLVCGKISTLAGNSYFDLNNGDFVLSNGAGKALSYENGILTIGGVNDESTDSILARLGITEGVASNAQSAADSAKEDAAAAQAEAEKVRNEYQTAVSNQESAMKAAIAGVQDSIGSLQNQIDGEVTAWFLKGVPTLDNQPAADWKVYKADSTLDSDATNAEYQRHEGDTYTDISKAQVDLSEQVDGIPVWLEQGSVSIDDSLIGKSYDEIKEANATQYRTKNIYAIDRDTTMKTLPLGLSALYAWFDSNRKYISRRSFSSSEFKLSNAPENASFFAAIYTIAYMNNYDNVMLKNTQKKNDGFVQVKADTREGFYYCIEESDGVETTQLLYSKVSSTGSRTDNIVLTKDCDRIIVGSSGKSIDTKVIYLLGGVLKSGTTVQITIDITNITQGSLAFSVSVIRFATIPMYAFADIKTSGTIINPDAGKSWRFCKGTSDSPTTTWHWHLIADSDAVKALVEAGKAQSTADGKSTTFVKQPTNYQVGDLWILQADNDHTAGKKGDILTANQSSATYNASHWEKNVKYTDDTAANAAKTAADNAKKAADAAQADATQALSNLAEVNKDGRVYISEMKSLAIELENIKQEKIQLVGTDGKGGEAQKWDASVDQNTYITAYNACVNALTYYTTESNAQNGYITIITAQSNQYSWSKITAYYSARQVLVNAIADAANKYSDSIKTTADKAVTDAAAAKTAADNAKSVADAATTRLNNWAADGVISPVEKQGIKDEIARIDADKSQITTEYTKYSLGTPTAFNTAYTDYRTKLEALSAAKPENINIPSDFSTKQTAYYTARTTALNAISTKADEVAKAYADEVSASAAQAALDNLEIGGRNIAIFNTAATTGMQKGTDYNFVQTIADTKTQLNLIVDDFNGSNGSSIKFYVNKVITEIGTYSYPFTLMADTSLLRIKHNGSKKDIISIFYFAETLKAGTNLVLSLTFTNVTQGTFVWKSVKIEKGNKATDWTPAPEDVEASIAESKTYTEGLVTALGDTLQSQIDGVVDSYFMEGVPTTSNAPANEWTTDELKKRHEGDTYTDITKFVDDKTTPYAGHSWRWCKGTGDSPATGWHWHEIADSDAVRALQNAAKAQDTADGKRRVFVVQPTPPYEIGDLWAQGDGDGKDILKCKTAKTAGQSFAQDDWEAASSALTKAGQVATEAATAKANAQTALTTLTNIASDSIFTKQEKCSVRTEWASIQAEFAKNTNNAKVCWGESGYTSNTEYAAYKTAYDSLNSYLTNTAKLSANEDTTITSATFNKNFSDYYGANVTLLNAIAKRVSEIEVAAMSIGTRNLFAKKYMLDWNAKSADTTTVNFDDYGEYYQIKENQVYIYVGGGESYNDILQGNVSFETGKQYCLKVKWRVPSEVQYSGLNLGFKYSDGTRSSWIVCANNRTTPIEATLVSASGKTVAGIVCPYGTLANTRIYEIQLTEGNKAPSGWAEAEADKETGGENLYTGDNPLTITANATDNYNYVTLVKNLQNDARYVFSCGKSVVKAGSTDKYAVLLYDFNASSATQARKLAVGTTRVEQAFTIPSTGTWSMLIYSGVNGSTAGISMEFTDIMVQKGNRATEYQKPIRKFLYNGNISISYKSKDYAQSKLLASGVYAGTYYAEMTSESKGAGIDVSNRDAFQNSCLVWFAAGYQNKDHLLKITNWGESVNISQRADVYVYTGQAAFIKDYTQDPTGFDVKFKADGTWTINGAQISAYTMEYLSGEAYEAKSKAEALDYLKAAIADGDTDVVGGLLLTNVLMLRDMDKNVTAGMSGLTTYKPEGSSTTLEDLVLLWGGGTYDEAFYAARNADYKKSANGDPITTLIKKDGTGKIGIFKISDTQAIIDVPNQGKVVIDASTANGGIFIKDKNGMSKIIITPKPISSFKPQGQTSINESDTLSDASSGEKYNYTSDTFNIPTSQNEIVISGYLSASALFSYGGTTTGYASFSVVLEKVGSSTTYSILSGKTNTVTIPTGGTASASIEKSYSVTKKNIPAGTYRIKVTITEQSGSNKSISISRNEWSVKGYYYPAYIPKTVIGADGIVVAQNGGRFFMVDNSGSSQKIYAKGLATTKGTSGSGELYVSQSFIDAFKALCDELNKFFPKVRMVGNNETNALECQKKVTAVRNMLDATSIIANS